MSEYPSKDMKASGVSSSSASYRLFVSTPTGQTFSLRNLARTVLAWELRAQLELVAGIPSVTYTLHYGCQTIESDTELEFDEDVQNGALLSLKFVDDWGRLYEAVSAGDSQATTQLCLLSPNVSDKFTTSSCDPDVTGSELRTESPEKSDSAVGHARFVALFLSCQRGDYYLTRWLVRTGE